MACDQPFFRVTPIPPSHGWRDFQEFARWFSPVLDAMRADQIRGWPSGGRIVIPAKTRGAPTAGFHEFDQVDANGDTLDGGYNSDNTTTATERNSVAGDFSASIVDMEVSFDPDGTAYLCRFTAPISAAGGTPPAPLVTQNNGTPTDANGTTFLNIPTTNGSTSIFEFVDSGDGSIFRMKPGTNPNDIIVWDGTDWTITTVPGGGSSTTITTQNNGVSNSTTVNTLNIPSTSTQILEFTGAGSTVTVGFETTGIVEGDVIRFDGTNWTGAPPLTVSDGTTTVNVWNVNFDSDYYDVVDDGDGEMTVTPAADGPGSISQWVTINGDGTKVLYSGDLRGRHAIVTVSTNVDTAANAADDIWASNAGITYWHIGPTYASNETLASNTIDGATFTLRVTAAGTLELVVTGYSADESQIRVGIFFDSRLTGPTLTMV